MAQERRPRPLRGLFLTFLISGLNLFGAFLTLTALGGLGEWTRAQFIGLFGVLEMSTGIAMIIAPNLWRLPVVEATTSRSTQVQLAPTVLVPHWPALAKAAAGLAMTVASAVIEGVSPMTLGVVPLVLLLAIAVLALSLITARFGVTHPSQDVLQLVVKRPNREDQPLPGVSLSALVLQFVLNILTFPAVKLLPPDALFQPELAPSPALLAWTTAVTAVLSAGAWLCWRGRISRRAPREQQREAEQFA